MLLAVGLRGHWVIELSTRSYALLTAPSVITQIGFYRYVENEWRILPAALFCSMLLIVAFVCYKNLLLTSGSLMNAAKRIP